MGPVGSMEIDLVLEAASFMNGMKQAAQASAETGAAIKESMAAAREEMAMLKEAAVGLAEAFAVDMFLEQINKALEYAESIKKVTEATGISTTSVQGFMYAASQAGVATDTSQQALVRFTKALGQAANGNQGVLKTFKDLGVTSTDANTALEQFANGLQKVPTQAQKVADVTSVFGRNAAGLTEILQEGGKGLDEYTEAAQSLGIVLDGKVIDGAVDAEHKISALKMVLNAEWSNVIDQNASSIANLATQFINLAGAAGRYIEKIQNGGDLFNLEHPDLTKAAAYLTGGDANATMNNSYNRLMGNASGRQTLLDRNTQQIQDLDSGATGQNMYSAADRAKQRNNLLLQRKSILAADVAQPAEAPHASGGGTLPDLKGKKGPRDRSGEQDKAFLTALASEIAQGLGFKESLTTDPGLQAMYQRQGIDSAYGHQDPDSDKWIGGSKDKEIDDNLQAGKYGDKDSDLAKARAEELKHQNDLNGELQYEVISRKQDDAMAQQALALQTNSLELQKDHLTAQEGLARTAAERQKLADQILDIEYQEKQNALNAELAQKQRDKASPEDIQLTKDKIAALPQQKKDAQAANVQANMGPLASYLDKIPKTLDDINESLQNVAVDGLGKFTDGILAAVNGTGSLGDAFKDLTNTIIQGIEKIVIEETIIKPIGNLLTGGSSGGGGILGGLTKIIGGSLLGGATSNPFASFDASATASLTAANATGNAGILSDFAGGRANGGLAQPGNYLVGERGPEIVSIGAPANVVNHAQMAGMSDAGRQITVNSTVQGVNDPAQVKRLSAQTIVSAAPALLSMSADNMRKQQKARKMR